MTTHTNEPAEMPATDTQSSATHSAPNDPRQAGWKDEIATPPQTYNANVPIDLIERDSGNRTPTPARVQELANTIKAEGLLQPIVLRSLGADRYRIIAGETRWLAFKLLGRQTIPAMIRASEADAEGKEPAGGPSAGDVAKRLVENLSRSDLNPIDEARGFKQLAELGRTQREIGGLFGRSQPAVANAIRMLSLPDEVQDLIRTGRLSAAHGVSLARFVKTPRICERMADYTVDAGLTAKNLDGQTVPHAYQLKRDGYVLDIKTRGHEWDKDPVYTVPKELLERPEFVESDWCVYYLREPGTPDLWTPEKERQDEAREAKAKTAQAKKEKALASGQKTKEQIDREEKIAGNRKLRAEIDRTYEDALDALRVAKEVTPDMLAVLIEHALADGRVSRRVEDMEAALAIKLPAQQALPKGDWRADLDHYDLLLVGPVNAAKLAVGAILMRRRDEDLSFVDDVSPEIRLIAQTAPPITSGQQIERAAKRLGVPAAKLVHAAVLWGRDFPIVDIAINTGLDKVKLKAIKVALEDDPHLGDVCRAAHTAAQALAAEAAKGKGAEKKPGATPAAKPAAKPAGKAPKKAPTKAVKLKAPKVAKAPAKKAA